MDAGKSGTPPSRPETIARARVRELLDATDGAALTLVSAPAGYGKTTALADWFGTLSGPAAWISLNEEDNDARALGANVLDVLDRLWPGATWEARQAVLGGSRLCTTVVRLLAAALPRELGDARLTIVLDDVHHLTDASALELVAALIDALPNGTRFILSGRAQPLLRLGRRRAARRVADIGPADLAFSPEEAERLLNQSLRLRLRHDAIETLNERVEGWPAGLSLAASALRERPGTDAALASLPGSREATTDYLVEEVLDALTTRMRDFLARTSVLDRLCVPLCDAVLDAPGAASLLAEARRTNLFLVPVESEDGEYWVRFHGLFRSLLKRELAARDGAAVVTSHRRAAAWFRDHGMAEQAIEHASAAGDGVLAAKILDEARWPLIVGRRYTTIRRLVARMPPERGELGPLCELMDVLCMALEGVDHRLVDRRLDALEPHRDAPGVAPLLDRMRISPYFGDVRRARDIGWRMWEATADDMTTRLRLVGTFSIALWFAGEREAVQTVLAPYMGQNERPTYRSWELGTLALCETEDGELDVAERHAREAVDVIVASGGETALEAHWAYIALAEALRRAGKLDEAYERITTALQITGATPGSMQQACALVFQAQIDLASRNRRAAARRAAAARRILDAQRDAGVLSERLMSVERAVGGSAALVSADSEPTPAERRVLALLSTEMTRPEIAAELRISLDTVKSHTRRLYRRLGARSREEAVELARERGLL